MLILGIQNDNDSGICVMRNGEIVEAVSEERFSRVKLQAGIPFLSLKYIQEKYGFALSDFDYIVYSWYSKKNNYGAYAEKLSSRVIDAVANEGEVVAPVIFERIRTEFERDEVVRENFDAWLKENNIPAQKVVYLDHHSTHAWSAYSISPYKDSFVFTSDGRGDLKSTAAFIAAEKEGVTEIDSLLSFDSLGFLYGQITGYLGFTPHRHEGKVTGLAAFGDAEKTLPIFKKVIDWRNDTIQSDLTYFNPFYTNLPKKFTNLLEKQTKEDIAAGLQTHCENLLVKYIRFWISKLNRPEIKTICLAGGIFGNVKINQRIREIKGVEGVFVAPHMGDGGLPLGSVCYQNFLLTGKAKVNFETAYLGPGYSNEEVEAALNAFTGEVVFDKFTDKIQQVTELLKQKKVVGYFEGRMEYGPRALGARSIIHPALDRTSNDWLNKRLNRTEFMPFAPVTPIEYAAESYVGWSKNDVCAHFMTMTYDCTDSFARMHQAVTHVDQTARPQIVQEGVNKDYYKITKAYCDQTGERALMNTSFNAHEEPIVCSPTDAIRSLINGCIDILVLENYQVELKK